jgi:hypothetical protein
MKFKYFYKNDANKESIGIIKSSNLNTAFEIASKIKQLSVEKFKKIFNIEEV